MFRLSYTENAQTGCWVFTAQFSCSPINLRACGQSVRPGLNKTFASSKKFITHNCVTSHHLHRSRRHRPPRLWTQFVGSGLRAGIRACTTQKGKFTSKNVVAAEDLCFAAMLCRCTRRSPTLPSFFTQHPHIRTETRSTMADPFKLVDRLEEIDVLTETQK